MMTDCRASLLKWLERRGGSIHDHVFPSRVDYLGHPQHTTICAEWVTVVGLDSREYGTHSLRRTKASMIYKVTGNLRAVQLQLGHRKIENTVRYLGVDMMTLWF